MIICIFSSLDFTNEIIDVSIKLAEQGHTALLPPTAKMINDGVISFESIQQEKLTGEIIERIILQDSIRQAFIRLKESDVALVLNYSKNDIENYIGGNTFLEMGFAYILNKPIFLLNEIPNIHYEHEIRAMCPVVLNGNLSKIN